MQRKALFHRLQYIFKDECPKLCGISSLLISKTPSNSRIEANGIMAAVVIP